MVNGAQESNKLPTRDETVPIDISCVEEVLDVFFDKGLILDAFFEEDRKKNVKLHDVLVLVKRILRLYLLN